MTSTQTDRIDGLSTSTAIKPPVRVATTANITLSGLQTIDGQVLADGDRVLVWQQTTASENGIYCASTGTWSRAQDFNGNRDVQEGTTVFVNEGSGQGWYRVTSDNITVGTSDIDFVSTVLAIASDFPNVKDTYGAAGDGVTDDTSEIDSALSGNKFLYFPSGTYLYSGIPDFDGHIIFGDDAVIQIASGIHTSATPAHLQFVQGVRLKGTDHETLTLNSIGTVSGSTGAYSVPLTVDICRHNGY